MKSAIFIFLVSSFGCTVAPLSGSSKIEYLSDQKIAGVKSEQIKENLTRSGYNSIFGDSVKVFPVTGAYIEASQEEIGKKNLDSVDQINKKITKIKDVLLTNNTCFNIDLYTMNGIDKAQFKNWRAKVENSQGKLIEAVYTNVIGYDSVPKVFMTTSTGTTWSNQSFVCVSEKIDLKNNFSLHLIQQLGDEKPIKLSWIKSN